MKGKLTRIKSVKCSVCGAKGIRNFDSLAIIDGGLTYDKKRKELSYSEIRVMECKFCHSINGFFEKRNSC